MKKSIIIALIVVIGALLPVAAQAAPLQKLSWRAEYYDNPNLAGRPVFVSVVDKLDLNFGLGAPGLDIPRDHFSARFTDLRRLERGSYLFVLTVDDGARVWLDGKLIIDAWDLGQKVSRKAKVFIPESGDYELQIAYFDDLGPASIKLDWFQLAAGDEVAGAWNAEYFTNTELAGPPAVMRQDGFINFDWNSGQPDPRVTRDNFSVRWTRSIYLDRPCDYVFRIQHDDGMRIYVDGKVIYESWFDQGPIYQVRRIPLEAGNRTFVVEFYDHIGNATAQVGLEADPGNYEEINVDRSAPGVIVDNDGGYFQWGGPVDSRFVYGGGYGNDFFWTYNTTSPATNYGRWTAPVSAPGNYEIYAYIPDVRSTAGRARYLIDHFGQRDERIINQGTYHNEFVSLGIYYFGGDGNEGVTLYDSTGEGAAATQVAFDALKFVRH